MDSFTSSLQKYSPETAGNDVFVIFESGIVNFESGKAGESVSHRHLRPSLYKLVTGGLSPCEHFDGTKIHLFPDILTVFYGFFSVAGLGGRENQGSWGQVVCFI